MSIKNEDKILSVGSYGLSLFSSTKLKSFLIENNKRRKKKLLEFFQKNKDFYLTSLDVGAWLPIPAIDSVAHLIKLNDVFDEDWKKLKEVSGFNLEIGEDESLWITDIGAFYSWDSNDYDNNVNDISYYTADNKKRFSDFRFTVAKGKYLVAVECYIKIETLDKPQYGYNFVLTPVEKFEGYLDPRDDEKYNFNIRELSEARM